MIDKKIALIILLVLFILSMTGLYYSANILSILKSIRRFFLKMHPYCIETDEGMDYYNKGASHGRDAEGIDYYNLDFCETDYILNEWYCVDKGIKQNVYNCTNGCFNGACVE
jgi:hypothetical protein